MRNLNSKKRTTKMFALVALSVATVFMGVGARSARLETSRVERLNYGGSSPLQDSNVLLTVTDKTGKLPQPAPVVEDLNQGTNSPPPDGSHDGPNTRFDIDYDTPNDRDEVVTAPAAGTAYVHYDSSNFGNHVNLDVGPADPNNQNGPRHFWLMAHNKTFLVKNGQQVEMGQPIAMEGCTGLCYGDHIHFGLHLGNPQDNAVSSTSVDNALISSKDVTAGQGYFTLRRTTQFVAGRRYESDNTYPSHTLTDIDWHFDNDSRFWHLGPNGGASTIGFNSPGAWILQVNSDPSIVSPLLDIQAGVINGLEITMASQAADTLGAVYFATESSPNFSDDKVFTFSVIPGGGYHTIPVPLTGKAQWQGRITRLRVDPVGNANGQAVGIQRIRLVGDTGGGEECTPTSISQGETKSGSLTISDCVVVGTNRRYDVYAFNGVAGQGIAASMDSSGFDTYLYLTNSSNQILDEDNNSGPGTNSRIPGSSGFFTLPTTGSYFLWASSATDNTTGNYSVSLSGCSYSLSTYENEVSPGTGSTNFFMDASSGCEWFAVSDSTSWLTTSSSGSGDGTIRYDYTANTSTSPRTGRITAGGQVHTVTQIGVGGAGHVQFSLSSYSANEAGGDATITVTRSGGTATGNVSYSTSNGTAMAGVDYTPVSGVLIFSKNVTSRTFTVPILDDTASEGNESINLSLSTPSISLTLGSPSTATLTIVDNDSSPTRTLTVASSDPSSGVGVTVTPNDNSGQGNGTTQFTRVYANNVSVGLSAPATAGGNSFQKWQRDGSDWTTSQATSLSMDADHVMTAIYSSCAAPGVFSLVSPGNGMNLGATNLVTLSWGNSPNASSYDVYFGTNSNPNFWSSVTATSLNVNVNVGQTYWWKVVARVGCSSSLTSATAIWSFSVNSVAPANDNFANAQSISGNSASVNGTNAGATKESGEPNHANNTGGASIWYFWSAPADGYVTITTVGSNFDTLLAVYTNSTLSGLTPIGGNDDINSGNQASSVTFNTIAGTVYRIAVDGWAGAMGNTTLNWSFIPDTNRVNVALASNGGLATASSATAPDGTGTYFPSVAIDGDHKGLNTSFWRDDTGDSYPDWLQVDFAGSKTIHEIDVYTLQDNYTNPVEPSLNMNFNLYGITVFNVQYWSDFWGWVNVPGGSVTGNTNVWRRFTFADISTTKVRVLVNNALASRSRIVELEAYGVLAPTSAVNVASSSNGGVASASSTTPPDGSGTFVPSVAIDGDHKGLNTSFWRDGTGDSYPDWLQVDFAGSKTIHEIDVYTLQDDYTNPGEPSPATTFSLYGITAFDVQYWNGSGWVTVPGGSVTGNNNVWRRFTFSDITTSKVRVLVNNALASRSRIVELEAYSLTAPNVASAANGGIASASSTTPPDGTGTFVPSVAIDGDRKGLNTSFWRDGTGDSYPDWLQVDFAGNKIINEIDVYTLQDNYTNPVEPTGTMTFNLYGITAFDVQYWTGSSWITVPGGSVSGNNSVWRKVTFSALSTSKIRVLVNNALASRSRIVEVEAY